MRCLTAHLKVAFVSRAVHTTYMYTKRGAARQGHFWAKRAACLKYVCRRRMPEIECIVARTFADIRGNGFSYHCACAALQPTTRKSAPMESISAQKHPENWYTISILTLSVAGGVFNGPLSY